MGHTRPLFRLFSVFSDQQTIQLLQPITEKISIQHPVLGFEPTAF